MIESKKKYFENKIKNANCIQLITITYEILLYYLNESLYKDFDKNLEHADRCIDELLKSVNFNATPSDELLNLYVYSKTNILKSRIEKDKSKIKEIIPIFEKLFETYKQLDKANFEDSYYITYDKKGCIN